MQSTHVGFKMLGLEYLSVNKGRGVRRSPYSSCGEFHLLYVVILYKCSCIWIFIAWLQRNFSHDAKLFSVQEDFVFIDLRLYICKGRHTVVLNITMPSWTGTADWQTLAALPCVLCAEITAVPVDNVFSLHWNANCSLFYLGVMKEGQQGRASRTSQS